MQRLREDDRPSGDQAGPAAGRVSEAPEAVGPKPPTVLISGPGRRIAQLGALAAMARAGGAEVPGLDRRDVADRPDDVGVKVVEQRKADVDVIGQAVQALLGRGAPIPDTLIRPAKRTKGSGQAGAMTNRLRHRRRKEYLAKQSRKRNRKS